MAISTYKVFLMKKADTGEQWSKLIDIKEFPDLGGEPEMLETTTLSDNMVGWEIPAEYVDIFSNLVIIGAVLMVSCKYITEAFTKFKAILDATKEGKSYDEIK